MVIEPGHETPEFFDWIGPALLTWLVVGLVLIVFGVGLALLFAIISRGPGPGYRTVAQRLREGTLDLLSTSPLRILALAQLSVKEAVRKKVFVALVVFVIIIAGAAWLMTPGAGNEPAKLYLDFVLFWAITVPVLLVAVFLAVFSLPGEIANHTIYTVVTKPVRPTEIVLGRIVGFTAIGSVMLLVMGIVGYFFVVRTLDHTHVISGADLTRFKALGGEGAGQADRKVFHSRRRTANGAASGTSRVQEHAHEVEEIDIETGTGQTDEVNQHRHLITQRSLGSLGKKGDIQRCEPESADSTESPGAGFRPRIRVVSDGAHRLTAGAIVKITNVVGTDVANDVWVVDQVEDNSFVLKESQFFGDYQNGSRTPEEMVKWLLEGDQNGDGKLSKAELPAYFQPRFEEFDLNKNGILDREEIGKIGLGKWQQVRYEVGAPQGFIIARVPRLADRLQFLNRDGTPGPGTNVGTEWDYRKAIEGGTGAAAEFHFKGLRKSDADENGNLRLQMTLAAFRTTKWKIEERIPGNIELVNGDFISDKIPFTSNEFERQEIIIPGEKAGRSKKDNTRREKATLFDDYVSEKGELIVRITCAAEQQYLSMAQGDVYFLAARDIPAVNYLKGCISIWFQLILVVSLGVTFSTFLNGFVALLTTGGVLFASLLIDKIREIASGEAYGGASFESLFRVLTRAPMTTELDPNSYTTPWIVFLDDVVRLLLHVLLRVLPDLSRFSSVDFVAQGFSVPWNNLFVQFFTLLGFVIPLCLLAHYILKGREIAA